MEADPLGGLNELWAFSPAIDGSGPTFSFVRTLTDIERNQIARALPLFTELTVGATFLELQRAHEELRDSLVQFSDSPDQYTSFQLATEVRRRFRHWLADVTTFTDRLHPMVTRLFGRDHEAFTVVPELLKAERDSNFAFELVVDALRNESAHSQEVLNAIRHQNFVDRAGIPRRLNTVKIDPAELGRGVSRKADKQSLARARGLIDVGLLAARTMDSCLAVHVETIRCLREELEPLLAVVQSLHHEVTALGASWSLIAGLGEPKGSKSLSLQSVQNPWQQARDLSSQLSEWNDEFVGKLHVQMSPEQLESLCTEIRYVELISVGMYDQVPSDFLQRFLGEHSGLDTT